VDSVAAAESAIAGKRLTLIEQTKGCHESMAPFFLSGFGGYEEALDDLVNVVVISAKSGTVSGR
jgi:hypothetical protein